jgi:hypothetical protein
LVLESVQTPLEKEGFFSYHLSQIIFTSAGVFYLRACAFTLGNLMQVGSSLQTSVLGKIHAALIHN